MSYVNCKNLNLPLIKKKILNLPQIGDVAVLDISATKVDQDESNVQKIPSAESKGLPVCTEDYTSVSFSFVKAS